MMSNNDELMNRFFWGLLIVLRPIAFPPKKRGVSRITPLKISVVGIYNGEFKTYSVSKVEYESNFPMRKDSLKSSLCSFSFKQAAFLHEGSTIRFAGLNATQRNTTIAATQTRATSFNWIRNNFNVLCSITCVFRLNIFLSPNIPFN